MYTVVPQVIHAPSLLHVSLRTEEAIPYLRYSSAMAADSWQKTTGRFLNTA